MSDEPETCAFCSQDLSAEDQAFELHERLRDTCDEFRKTLNCRHARIGELEKENTRLTTEGAGKDETIERLQVIIDKKNISLREAQDEIGELQKLVSGRRDD